MILDVDPPPRLRLYLMRHGETATAGLCCGQSDAALSRRGMEESRRLCEALKQAPLAAVYSSDLVRAGFAAGLIAESHGLEVEALASLREIDMGEWGGRSLADLNAKYPEMVRRLFTDPMAFAYPGGEAFASFCGRVQNAVQTIVSGCIAAKRADAAQVEAAVVSHAGVCRAILGSVLEMPPRTWLRLAQDYACLNIIDWSIDSHGALPTVIRLNSEQ